MKRQDSRSRPGRPGAWLRLLIAALALLLGAGLPASVHAAVRFDVFLGYDGYVPEGSWFPVVCEVKNDGPTFTGIIEVQATSYGQSQTRQLTVELPTGTQKRLLLPAFCGTRYSDNWTVRLLNERGREIDRKANLQARRMLRWDGILAGAIVRTVEGLPQLPQVRQQLTELQPATARLQVELFPDNSLALQGLQTIYLNSEKALELKVGQVNALLAWLQEGGHLVVGVEQPTDVNANPWLRGLLPCELTGLKTVKPGNSFQEWLARAPETAPQPGSLVRSVTPGRQRPGTAPVVTSPSNPFTTLAADPTFEQTDLPVVEGRVLDGRVALSVNDAPLIIRADRGRGRVTALLFSSEREPFRSWKNRPWFWARLFEVPPSWFATADYYNAGGWSVDGIFGSMIDSKQIRKLPVGWLLLLLLVYLAVIGPFDYFWLKKIRRPMLTWITFPFYVVLFSGLIYLIGYKLRAGETEWNELQVVDILPRGEKAQWRGRTFASVYSPSNTRYPLASDLPFATLRGEYLGNFGGGQEASRAFVEQRANTFKAEAAVPVWTIGLYVSDWLTSGDPLIAATVVADTPTTVRVTVHNRSGHRLSPVRLAIAGRLHDVGELAAGETRNLQVNRAQGRMIRDFAAQHTVQFEQAVQQRQRALGDSRRAAVADVPGSAVAASFILLGAEARGGSRNFVVTPGLDLSGLLNRGYAIVLAYADDCSVTPPLNRFSPRRSHHAALLRLAVPVPGLDDAK